MKITLSVLALCGSVPDLVGESVDAYMHKRRQRHLERASKRKKIVNAILTKPKKFFGIGEEMILKFVTKKEFGAKVRTAVTNLTSFNHPNLIEATVIEFEDERLLRGNN